MAVIVRGADQALEIDTSCGAVISSEIEPTCGAEVGVEIESRVGAGRSFEIDAWRGADEVNEIHAARGAIMGSFLEELCRNFEDIQRTRIAAHNRGSLGIEAQLRDIEDRVGRQIAKELHDHPLWPWLSEQRGLTGVTTARVVAIIGDPWRFPGQACTVGHIMRPVQPIGGPCPDISRDEDGDAQPCTGTMLAPRETTGVRSLWRYFGLDVEDGRLPMRRKGKQGHWHVVGRSLILNDVGIAGQIVRQRTPKYRDIYDRHKARLLGADVQPEIEGRVGAENRVEIEALSGADAGPESEWGNGADPAVEIEGRCGADERTAIGRGVGAEGGGESEPPAGTKPRWQVEKIARTVAAKEFIGDLLMEWKRRTPLDDGRGIDQVRGRGAS